jgi:hypothetical protein
MVLGAGCAAEVPPRNTVQHGALAKEDLVGADGKAVWYYLQSVADVPYSTGFTFAGEQSILEKIRWDIQEKVLYARRAYEWIRGSEVASSGEQGSDPAKIVGAPVAAFAIEKHFDIIRDYNSATGEEINKIVENDEDRRWYERKFMRVDWSKNLVPNFEFLVQFEDAGVAPLKQEAVPYYVSDPDDPDAFRIRRPDATAEDPRPTADYLELTSKLIVTPEMATIVFSDGAYRMPACWMAEDYGPTFSSTDCSAQELKLRHSFLRGGARDYDPLAYDDRWMERIGYFSTERQSWDPQYQETETGRVRLANRFNIWQKTLSSTPCSYKEHYQPSADPRKAFDAARRAADSACRTAEGEGSACSMPAERCTLAPANRGGVRKIVYYLSVGFPEDLVATAQASVASWNDAFQTTAARLLYPQDNPLEAKALEQRKQEIGAIFELRSNDCSEAKVNEFLESHPDLGERVRQATSANGTPLSLTGKELIRACSTLEQATASRPLAERFVWQRIGDLRYSMIYWLATPSRAMLLGYGPSSADPETGELIQATAFIYGAIHDTYAARATDIVGLLNCADEACIESYAQGVPIADWVAMAKSTPAKGKTFTQMEVDQMAGQMQLGWVKAAAKKLPALDWRTFDTLRSSVRQRSAALSSSNLLGSNGMTAASRLKVIQGTALEDMARNQFLQAAGLPAGTLAAPGDALGQLTLYDWAGPGMAAQRRKLRRHLAQHRVELATFYDSAILGLALRYKETGKPRDKIFADLRARLFRGVAEHELGHTLGLRHNFAASYDALNYQPAYWKLRSLDPQGKALPRYKSPLTDLELKGNAADSTAREGLGSYQYSSVMDYGAKFNSDIASLGYYDVAAIKFGYGGLTEVFDKIGSSTDDRYLLANVQTSMRWGEPMLYTVACNGNDLRSVHYTEYPRLVGGVGNLGRANRVDVPLSRMTTQKLSQLAPGCGVYQLDVLWDSDVPSDDKGRLEVPYRFCSDEFESASPECSAFDAGADPYEQVASAIESYHNYYIFHNLKLDRLGYSFWDYLDRIDSRYFDPLRSSMQFYLLNRTWLTGEPRGGNYLGDTEVEKFFTSDEGYGPWTVAVDRSLNFFFDVLATPEVGNYWIDEFNRYDQWAWVDENGDELPPDLVLGVPDGKYYASSWDFDSGYFWYDKMTHVGIFNDKYLALWTLSNAETWFIGRDTASDSREYAINFYRLYPDLITRYVRGIMTGDWAAIGNWGLKGKLLPRDFTQSSLPPRDALPVNPQVGFTVQFFAALLGVSQIPVTYDTSFLDSCRIWVKGAQEEITPAEAPVCFTDPVGGKTFCAATRKDEKGQETGIGVAMIAQANTLKDAYAADASELNKIQLLQYVDSLELMRSITRAYGYTPL